MKVAVSKLTKPARALDALRLKHLNTTMRYIDLNENKLRNAIELL